MLGLFFQKKSRGDFSSDFRLMSLCLYQLCLSISSMCEYLGDLYVLFGCVLGYIGLSPN